MEPWHVMPTGEALYAAPQRPFVEILCVTRDDGAGTRTELAVVEVAWMRTELEEAAFGQLPHSGLQPSPQYAFVEPQ